MNVQESMVRKIHISGIENFDPISVIVEDFGPGAGKITIAQFGDAWSHGWPCMGEQHTLVSFFCKCDVHYLAKKLSPSMESEVRSRDESEIEASMKREIIRLRREDSLNHEKARELWNETTNASYNIAGNLIGDAESGLLYEIYGDEWWYSLPRVANPNYERLTHVVKTVQAAFGQLKEKK